MTHLDVSSYKDDLIKSMVSNQNLVEAIDSRQANIRSGDDLPWKNIFPYAHIDFTQKIADSYVLISVQQPGINRANRTFVDIRLVIQVVVHRDRMKMGRATRADVIAEELRKMLDGSNDYGYGVLEMYSSSEYIIHNEHICRELHFRTIDLKLSSDKKAGRFL